MLPFPNSLIFFSPDFSSGPSRNCVSCWRFVQIQVKNRFAYSRTQIRSYAFSICGTSEIAARPIPIFSPTSDIEIFCTLFAESNQHQSIRVIKWVCLFVKIRFQGEIRLQMPRHYTDHFLCRQVNIYDCFADLPFELWMSIKTAESKQIWLCTCWRKYLTMLGRCR